MQKYLDLKSDNILNKIAKEIRNGAVAIFPTDTVYGIGTNGLNEEAVRKLFTIKERPLNKPISLLACDLEMIKNITKDISDIEYKLIEKFLPGPLTIILKKKDIIPNILTSNTEFVGIRIPNDKNIIKLIKLVGSPIAASSANISGELPTSNLQGLVPKLKEQADYILDYKNHKKAIASTVVQVIEGTPHILREGEINKEQINNILKRWK